MEFTGPLAFWRKPELVRQIEITSLNQVTLYDPNYTICKDSSKEVRQKPVFKIYPVDSGDIY
jgi:hypothetical protein